MHGTPEPRHPAAFWRPNAFSRLHWQASDEAGEFHLVHDETSGRTHFLTPLGAWLLQRLADAPAGCAQLQLELRADCDDPDAPGLDQALADALDLLAAELLIEPCPPSWPPASAR